MGPFGRFAVHDQPQRPCPGFPLGDPVGSLQQKRQEFGPIAPEDLHRRGGPLGRVLDLGDPVGDPPELFFRLQAGKLGGGEPKVIEDFGRLLAAPAAAVMLTCIFLTPIAKESALTSARRAA